MKWHGAPAQEPVVLKCAGVSKTRQEFAPDADINSFLRRYGAPQGAPFQAGEVDFTQGRLDAWLSIRDAGEAFERLPKALRKAYPSWDALLAAGARGDVVMGPDGPVLAPVAPSGAGAGFVRRMNLKPVRASEILSDVLSGSASEARQLHS